MAIVCWRLEWLCGSVRVGIAVGGGHLSIRSHLSRRWRVRSIWSLREAIFCRWSVWTHSCQAPALGGGRSAVRSAKMAARVVWGSGFTCWSRQKRPRAGREMILSIRARKAAAAAVHTRWGWHLRCGGEVFWRRGGGIAYRGSRIHGERRIRVVGGDKGVWRIVSQFDGIFRSAQSPSSLWEPGEQIWCGYLISNQPEAWCHKIEPITCTAVDSHNQSYEEFTGCNEVKTPLLGSCVRPLPGGDVRLIGEAIGYSVDHGLMDWGDLINLVDAMELIELINVERLL